MLNSETEHEADQIRYVELVWQYSQLKQESDRLRELLRRYFYMTEPLAEHFDAEFLSEVCAALNHA